MIKALDVNGNALPIEFDELVSTDQPVVYWWKDGRKHYKMMNTVDEAIQAIDRAQDKKFPAYSVATIAKGRMVMEVSFYGPIEKYGRKDRYFLGTNGAHLWWLEKKDSRTKQVESMQHLADALHKYFAQQPKVSQRQDKVPDWAIAIKSKFPEVDIRAYGSQTHVDLDEEDLAYDGSVYTYTVSYRDETYGNEINGRWTDKWEEKYSFKLEDLKGETFQDSLLDIEYEEYVV